MIDVVDKSNTEVYVLLLQYNVETPQNVFAQFKIFSKSKELTEFQPFYIVNTETDEYIFLLIVMKCPDDKNLRSRPTTLSSKK